ncbi:MAG: type II secretion system minor pseudopilin GspI [Cocleimonas sp.]|nr:type II secretion system minor pseudopilin GspI [Cocleimonas sp.]
MNKLKSKGFTLIEVLVALMVIAVALGGAVKVMGSASSNISTLSQRTFAQWVGLNQLTNVQLKGAWLKVGESTGEVSMAERKWKWVQKVVQTEVDTIKRLEVTVYKSPKDRGSNPLVTVVGFLAKP